MAQRMQIDSLQLPIDWEKVQIHQEASRIGKRLYSPQQLPKDVPKYGRVCQECGRRQTHCPNFRLFETEAEMRERYGVYGPSCVIYLGFIKRVIFFMAACVLLFCVPLFVLNLVGVVCRQSATACNTQDVIYFWSTYNVIGGTPGSLPHHILWFVFSLCMCVFTVYLRYYSMHTYRTINSKNVTDSDFALCLRRLPEGTTQQDVKDLFEREIAIQYDRHQNKNQKFADQLKTIKVKDVILIYRFYQIMEVNDKNVKEFKKFVKDKKKGKIKEDEKFIPQPLPQVTEFANGAIVRFQNNRSKDLIIKTIQKSTFAKILNYFIPFYNAETQYKIKQKRISIARGPEPNTIQWKNFGFTQGSRIIRKIISFLFSVILLIFSATISIFISVSIQKLLVSTGIEPTYLTIILVVISLLFNIIISIVVKFCIQQIKLDLIDDEYCEQLTVSVINESINLGFFSIFAPIVAKLPAFIQVKQTESSAFPVVMFTTMIIQSFIGPAIGFLLQYFQLVPRILKLLNKAGILIKTQTQAYSSFVGSTVPFVSSYVYLVIIVWFGFLYGVVSPICVFIGLLGLILYYNYQRILFNSKYTIPVYVGPRFNSTMIDLLDLTPFLVGLFNLFFYETSQSARQFTPDGRVTAIIITTIVIGAVNALIPWKSIMHLFYNERQNDSIQRYDGSKIDITYESCYPASNPEFEELMKQPINLHENEQGNRRQKVNIKQYINSVRGDQEGMDTNCCCKP